MSEGVKHLWRFMMVWLSVVILVAACVIYPNLIAGIVIFGAALVVSAIIWDITSEY